MQNEFYANQWGLNNTGQNGGTAGIDINAPEAWTLTRGCNDIRVAVIDQGVDLDHPDLAANLFPGFDATDGGDGGINGDCWGNDAHGTCCAGIIGAVNNTIGTIGVAHNCRIIPIRVTYTRNGNEIWDDDWVVSAINHAWEDDGADVLSCSWRYQNVVAINTEINNALTSGRNNLGCVIVFAAGNNNNSVNYPANSNPDIIAVGAMSPCGQRKRSSSNIWEVNSGVSTDPLGVSCDNEKWWGSNYGSELDLIAPGVFIPTTDIQGTGGYNTASGTGGNYYQTFNGTSSATPHVAGVAALILSINSGLTQDQVRDIIETTCSKVGSYTYSTVSGRSNGTWNNEVGYGCVNAFAAVQRAAGGPINGSSFLCSTGYSYSVPFLNGLSVTWNRSANINMVSQQGSNPCTFSANGNGNGWIEAVISTTCNNTVTLPRQTVWVGKPNIPTQSAPATIYMGQPYFISASAQGAQSFTWTETGGHIQLVEETPGGTTSSMEINGYKLGQSRIYVKANNTCWSSNTTYKTITVVNSLYNLALTPNPANSEVEVSLLPAEETYTGSTTIAGTENTTYTINVVSSFGNPVYTAKVIGQRFSFPTVSIPEGLYIVTVSDGITRYEGNLLVKH